ncbi:DUF2785 domain-containing protein [Pseudoduganella sp. HUAS MS19]
MQLTPFAAHAAARFRARIGQTVTAAVLAAPCLGMAAAPEPAAAFAPGGCPASALREARSANWQVGDSKQRQLLALRAASCLASPDPVERDELAFAALQSWMRADKLDIDTVQELRTRLAAQLQAPDPLGFARPFAALVLADVARVDRIRPYLSTEQRAQLVGAATGYLRGVSDYRGFDEKQGWRHGVAHAADIMLQLSLNPALGRAEHEQILAAIASQAAPPGEHFYHYGEGERLMAAVFYLSRTRTMECGDWGAWFARLAAAPAAAGTQQSVLARRHNLNGFLQPLYINISESKDEAQRNCLKPLVLRALKQAAQ